MSVSDKVDPEAGPFLRSAVHMKIRLRHYGVMHRLVTVLLGHRSTTINMFQESQVNPTHDLSRRRRHTMLVSATPGTAGSVIG